MNLFLKASYILFTFIPFVFGQSTTITDITFGQTAALTGPLLRPGIADGIQIAFAEINAVGGVNANSNGVGGIKLHLKTYDDAGQDNQAAANVNTLVNNDKVFALLGVVGDASDVAIQTAVSLNMPILPVTGDLATRTPFNPLIINMRVSLKDEVTRIASHVLEELWTSRIAIISENNDDGYLITTQLTTMVSNAGYEVSAFTYFDPAEPATIDIAVSSLLSAVTKSPQVVILTTDDAAVAARAVKSLRSNPSFDANAYIALTSSAGGLAFRQLLTAQTNYNLIISQVVPPPNDKTYIVAKNFRKSFAAYGTPSMNMDPDTLEGYMMGRFAGSILDRMDSIGTSEIPNTVYETIMFKIDDILLGPFAKSCEGQQVGVCNCSQGMRDIFLTSLVGDGNHYSLIPGSGRYNIPLEQCSNDHTINLPILFGQMIPNFGNTAQLSSIANGIRAAFWEANQNGGVNGHLLHLVQEQYTENENITERSLATLDRYVLASYISNGNTGKYDLQFPQVAPIERYPPILDQGFDPTSIDMVAEVALELMAIVDFISKENYGDIHYVYPLTDYGSAVLLYSRPV